MRSTMPKTLAVLGSAATAAFGQETLPKLPDLQQPDPLPPLISPAIIGASSQAISQAIANQPRQPRAVSRSAEVQASTAAAYATVVSSVAQTHGAISQAFNGAHGQSHTAALQAAQRPRTHAPAGSPADPPGTAERAVGGLIEFGIKAGAMALMANNSTPTSAPTTAPTPPQLPEGIQYAGVQSRPSRNPIDAELAAPPTASYDFTVNLARATQPVTDTRPAWNFSDTPKIQLASWPAAAAGAVGGYLIDKGWEELKLKSPGIAEFDCKVGAATGRILDGLFCPLPPPAGTVFIPGGEEYMRRGLEATKECQRNANEDLKRRWNECEKPSAPAPSPRPAPKKIETYTL